MSDNVFVLYVCGYDDGLSDLACFSTVGRAFHYAMSVMSGDDDPDKWFRDPHDMLTWHCGPYTMSIESKTLDC